MFLLLLPRSRRLIRKRLKSGKYDTWFDLQSDVGLMFDNAREFNEEGSEIYNDTIQLQTYFTALIASVSGTELQS